MSEPNELERLRADLKMLQECQKVHARHSRGGSPYTANVIQELEIKIAKLEAEQADPWAKAREAAKMHLASGGHNVKAVAEWAFHLEADNAKQLSRIAELEYNYQCEVIDGGAVRDHLRSLVAELEARPVPPLDPKTVIATACKVIAKENKGWASVLMSFFEAGNAGIYPLAGDDDAKA